MNNKAHNSKTDLKTDVDTCLSILQAGIATRVLINTLDINRKIKQHATSDNIFKIQNIDGSTLYDSLELSFNTIDKTII